MAREVDSMPGCQPRILVADDDVDTRDMLSDLLSHEGYEPLVAADGERALTLAAKQPLDLALVDMVMPGPSGMSLAARLKELKPDLDVIIITAYGSEELAAEAMCRGAFYYLPKPLNLKLLPAKVEKALASRQEPQILRVKGLTLNLTTRHVMVAGESVALSCQEFDLLAYMVSHPCRTVSYDELWGGVWSLDSSPDKGVVQRTMSRLREKIGRDRIVCVWGKGYLLRGSERSPSACQTV